MNGTLRDDFTMGESSEKTEEVDIPTGMVGLIIGKGGENIRDLQMRSGCHIQVAVCK
jgi:far upstream element-binding protein